MTTSRIRRFYRRKFLNKPRYHQGAHVIADIELKQYKDNPAYVDAELHLADCYRCVDLDFDVHTRADARNALRKLAVLQQVLADFETALVAAVDEMHDRNSR